MSKYITPAGLTCIIIRQTPDSVTLLIDCPTHGQYEWTTDKRNFEKKYTPTQDSK